MTYFDHIKEESPFQTQRKFNVINHARIKMGRKRKVLLVKRSSVTDCQRRERGNPATIQGTTLQSNMHSTTVSFSCTADKKQPLSSNSSRASCTRWQIVRLQNSQTRLCEISTGKQTLSSCAQMRYCIWQQEFIKFSTIYFLYIFKYLCSASNKNQESRFDHSDLIHFLLHQSKSRFHIWREGQFGFILENRFLNKL